MEWWEEELMQQDAERGVGFTSQGTSMRRIESWSSEDFNELAKYLQNPPQQLGGDGSLYNADGANDHEHAAVDGVIDLGGDGLLYNADGANDHEHAAVDGVIDLSDGISLEDFQHTTNSDMQPQVVHLFQTATGVSHDLAASQMSMHAAFQDVNINLGDNSGSPEENSQEGELDGGSQTTNVCNKEIKRRIANKEAAKRSRMKSKAYVKDIEKKLQEAIRRLNKSNMIITLLRQENKYLKWSLNDQLSNRRN